MALVPFHFLLKLTFLNITCLKMFKLSSVWMSFYRPSLFWLQQLMQFSWMSFNRGIQLYIPPNLIWSFHRPTCQTFLLLRVEHAFMWFWAEVGHPILQMCSVFFYKVLCKVSYTVQYSIHHVSFRCLGKLHCQGHRRCPSTGNKSNKKDWKETCNNNKWKNICSLIELLIYN